MTIKILNQYTETSKNGGDSLSNLYRRRALDLIALHTHSGLEQRLQYQTRRSIFCLIFLILTRQNLCTGTRIGWVFLENFSDS